VTLLQRDTLTRERNMVMRRISRDVKLAAIRLYYTQILTLQQILDACGFSRRTFFRILKLWRETGDVVKARPLTRAGPQLLHCEDIQYLLRLIRQNPDYFLDELLHLLQTNRFISVHYTTIHRELERAGVSMKKLKRIACERDEDKRADFILCMAQYLPEEIGFVDEVSKDERTWGRRYGRSKKGRRAEKNQPFVRGRRTSTEALLTLDSFVAGTVVEGSMTKEMFLEWLEFNVVSMPVVRFPVLTSIMQLPKCTAYPGPLSVIIMDNARIHHGPEILALFDRFGMPLVALCSVTSVFIAQISAGVRLEYLPPYSPDLNPIEEAFSKIKHFI
jgi:transposase